MSFLTSRSYVPGDVIYEEKPFIKILKHDLWDKICAGCCAKSTGLKKCSACSVMKYCGKSCQKNDWPDHKLECLYLRNYTDFRSEEIVHMMGKLILKLKGKDWKTFTSRIFGVEVSFDDLLSLQSGVVSCGFSGLRNLVFEDLDITTPLESYIGKENVPDREILKELFGKVVTNSFGFFCGKYPYGNDLENIYVNYHNLMQIVGGAALFLGVSKIDHSCVPNAFYHATGASITVRAIRTIKKFEKVTMSYTNIVDVPLMHEMTTKWKFSEKCYCSDCSQVPGESKLTKILDASKAIGVIQETEMALQLPSVLPINYPNPTVTRGYLKNLLKRQNEVLGRTHLRRMQTLAKLYSLLIPELSKEELRAGYVELTESMKEVWGDYYPELATYYMCLVNLNRELGNEKEAMQYCFKLWRLESVKYGAFFIDGRWKEALSEDEFRYFMEKSSQE